MVYPDNPHILQRVAELLFTGGLINSNEKDNFSSRYKTIAITADGSTRRFFRVCRQATSLCVGVLPGEGVAGNIAEAQSAISIGRHLQIKKVPVPSILGADTETGLILFEDCGDTRLHDVLQNITIEEKANLYRRLVTILAHMQASCANGFKRHWCFDTPEYDTKLMVERESKYFLKELWYETLGGEEYTGIDEEFADLARQAKEGVGSMFLHRDFQCRNIMMVDSRMMIIDFQGGRLGPPGYDLASLMIDPYSFLPPEFQEEMLQYYLDELHKHIEFEENVFLYQYDFLQLQRNLQILGAFSFLSGKRGKDFFRQFIPPALDNLCRLLDKDKFQPYSLLRSIAEKASRRFTLSS